MNHTGLTEEQAKEFHAQFVKYFAGSFIASVLAHALMGAAVGGWSTWFTL